MRVTCANAIHDHRYTRTDTEYWRANAANMNLSEELKQLYALWMSGKGIAAAVAKQALGKGCPVFSWYSIMAGMGVFPDTQQLRAPTAREAIYDLAEIDDLMKRSRVNYPEHRAALGHIAPRRSGASLQVYFF